MPLYNELSRGKLLEMQLFLVQVTRDCSFLIDGKKTNKLLSRGRGKGHLAAIIKYIN